MAKNLIGFRIKNVKHNKNIISWRASLNPDYKRAERKKFLSINKLLIMVLENCKNDPENSSFVSEYNLLIIFNTTFYLY